MITRALAMVVVLLLVLVAFTCSNSYVQPCRGFSEVLGPRYQLGDKADVLYYSRSQRSRHELRTLQRSHGSWTTSGRARRVGEISLRSMGHVSGAYIELLERGKNSVKGIFEHSSFPHFVAGLVAGIFECLVGHPLDTIRIGVMTNPDEIIGPMAILKQLATAFSSPKAIIDIYRGVNSEMLSAALGGAILFGVNELLKGTLNDIDARRKARLAEENKEAVVENVEKGIANKRGFWSTCTPELVAAAGFTGMLDGFTSKPLEMIKLRQQVAEGVANAQVLNIKETYSVVVKEVGRRNGGGWNLFRGWLPTVIRETVGCMGFFAAYELTKVNLGNWERKRKLRALKRDEQKLGPGNKQRELQIADVTYEPSTGIILIAGAMAGLAYVMTSHPMENAAVLMQTDIPTLVRKGADKGRLAYRYANMNQCLRSIVKSGGLFSGLYRGAGTSVLRAIPSYAASWWGYELTLSLMDRYKRRRDVSGDENRDLSASEDEVGTSELVAALKL